MSRIIDRGIACILCLVLLTSSLYGCSKGNEVSDSNAPDTATITPIDTEKIAEVITDEIREEVEDIQEQTEVYETISENWEDYLGDIDTLVYGLMMAELGKCYSVFDAVVELDDETQIYGIGYTDYDCYFESETPGEGFFPAGFIGLIGEEGIDKSRTDNGVEIIPLSQVDDGCHFVYAYDTDPYMEHCVAWGKYIRYGVGDNGSIIYDAEDYQRGVCDEELGTLYSFDEKKVVFENNFDEFQYFDAESLFADVDYDALEKEVNRVLEEQDYNFAKVDVNTAVYMAQEAFNTYLLSLQEETFMGYRVADLLEISSELDPNECIQFTPEGMVTFSVSDLPYNNPSAFVKWSTGIICGLAVVGCIALDVFVPALMPLSSAIMGATIEVFMEVVVANHELKDVNWGKVGVAALSGALIAWVSPALAAGAAGGVVKAFGSVINLSNKALLAIGEISGDAVLALSNGVISGGTSAIFTAMDGGDGKEIFDAFTTGTLLGGLVTVGAAGLGEAIGVGAKAISSAHPNSWLTKASGKATEWISGHQVHFSEKVENVLIPKSIHQATEAALYELRVSQCGGSPVLTEKILNLPSDNNPNYKLLDMDGNEITKADLASNGGNGVYKLTDECDPELAKAFAKKGVTEIKITNGDPDFAPCADFSFKPSAGITSNRDVNMNEYRKDLVKRWTNDPDSIPPNIKEELQRMGCDLKTFSASDLKVAFSNLELTLHEGSNGMVYIVDRTIHKAVRHYGGVALAKALEKIRIGRDYISDLATTQALSTQGSLIGGFAH